MKKTTKGKMPKGLVYTVQSAVIGALYAALTLLLAPISFGAVQFRVSEALTVLPIFTPAAVPGLFIGCMISNAVGLALGTNIAGPLDIVLGSAATLIAAILTLLLRRFCIKGVPFLSLLPPVLLNALVIGFELSFLIPDGVSYLFSFLTIGLGELVVVIVLGIPLILLLRKYKLFDR